MGVEGLAGPEGRVAMIVRAALALLTENMIDQATDRSVLRVHGAGELCDESGPVVGEQALVVERKRELTVRLDHSHGLDGLPEGRWPACLRPCTF